LLKFTKQLSLLALCNASSKVLSKLCSNLKKAKFAQKTVAELAQTLISAKLVQKF
jgi:hypothetical protein